jgi:sterol 3beta-glucosyltransferase
VSCPKTPNNERHRKAPGLRYIKHSDMRFSTSSKDSRINLIDQVRSDGRLKVQFHDDPSQLADYCTRARHAFAENPCRLKVKRTKSAAFLDEDNLKAQPRLSIAIQIVGSRGDVQPFIPIAQMLMSEPHNPRVRICTHPIYKEFVEGFGIEFFSIGGDPQALMKYMVRNPGLLPGRQSVKEGAVKKQRQQMTEIIYGAWRSCIEAGDGMGEKQSSANVPLNDKLFLAGECRPIHSVKTSCLLRNISC